MRNNQLNLKSIYFLSALACVFTLACLTWGCNGANAIENANTNSRDNASSDPCWFMSLNDKSISYERIKEREDRERFGYSAEISLDSAVEILNQEKHCIDVFSSYADLTSDEVIAAIAGGPDDVQPEEVISLRNKLLWDIASRKELPKGSLLRIDRGGRIQGSALRPNGTIQPVGIRISLFLGLDQGEQSSPTSLPRYSIIIRKHFSSIEVVK